MMGKSERAAATAVVYNERRPRVHDVCPAKKGIRVSGIYAKKTHGLSVCLKVSAG